MEEAKELSKYILNEKLPNFKEKFKGRFSKNHIVILIQKKIL